MSKKTLGGFEIQSPKYGVLDMLDASKGESWIFQHSRESAPLKKEVGVITLSFWHLDAFHKKRANFLEVNIHWRLRCPSSCLSELPYFNALEPPEIAGCVPYKSPHTVWQMLIPIVVLVNAYIYYRILFQPLGPVYKMINLFKVITWHHYHSATVSELRCL